VELAGPHARPLAVVFSLILLWSLEEQGGQGTPSFSRDIRQLTLFCARLCVHSLT
jgi:hypothetical protein